MTDSKNNLGDKPDRFWTRIKTMFILGTYRNNLFEKWWYQHDNKLVDNFGSGDRLMPTRCFQTEECLTFGI